MGTAEAEEGYQTEPPEGVSWKPVVPIKNAILVNYDGESYLDDYSYLASVPAAVFYSKSNDRIYSAVRRNMPDLSGHTEYKLAEGYKDSVTDIYKGKKEYYEGWVAVANAVKNIVDKKLYLAKGFETAEEYFQKEGYDLTDKDIARIIKIAKKLKTTSDPLLPYKDIFKIVSKSFKLKKKK